MSHRRKVSEWERSVRQAELANRRLKLPFIGILCKDRPSFQLARSVTITGKLKNAGSSTRKVILVAMES